MQKLPLGISDFKEIRKNDYYFIDKSLFIKEIINEDAQVILLPRPRRFGKTLNISMLRYYFSISEADWSLYQNLKIAAENEKYLQEFAKYPLIYLTFKGLKDLTWEDSLKNIEDIIAAEYQRHDYLLKEGILTEAEEKVYREIINLEAEKVHYQKALLRLTEYLERYHDQKVIVLIDEYDQPIQSGYLNDYYPEVVNFMRLFLENGLKDNASLHKSVLTGILRVAKESIFSGLNNLVVNDIFTEKYNQFFGLLPQEVEAVFKEYDLEYKLKEIKNWYNGYNYGGQTIYNPWSIINCLYYQGEIKPYWVNSSGNELIRELLLKGNEDLKSSLELLIQNQSIEKKIDENIVFAEIESKSSSIWSFLLFSGYLSIVSSRRERGRLFAELEIPNQEIKYIYEEIFLDWLEENIGSQKLSLMLNALTEGDVESFAQIFREFTINSLSYFDTSGSEAEKVYHAFVLGLLLNLRDNYQVKSNRESGYGRYDIMIIPDDKNKLGIIIEFKKISQFSSESKKEALDSALQQIEEKNYQAELNSLGINDILKLAVVFSGKEVEVKSGDSDEKVEQKHF
ncbi:PD-(D/E)XK nuclease superfamily protein [Halanaerobium saccharolyticum]|uniref:PD-(D/E)XK nuclease superfamily protein n=1 Tax=Halanaerobium saccharolyticum TaxID=43595 RepID=A0A2T5RHT5_9FIRM|nr:AAA family ATPase [Halanaerobium saccharolyticum]PTV96825.1 PD-(D/E)XK nuclease superfamily protein [Halanaerobium saccharolyticum]